jgi:serine O-acetyltransferase
MSRKRPTIAYGFRQMAGDMASDVRGYAKGNALRGVVSVLFRPGLKLLLSVRWNRWIFANGALRWLSPLTEYLQYRRYSCQISPTAEIARGVKFPHPIGIVIGHGVRVESGAYIFQQVTLGGIGDQGDGTDYPCIGAGVILYAGVKVIGPVRIGPGTRVGANAVVTKDLPGSVTAAGVPARILAKSTPLDEAIT